MIYIIYVCSEWINIACWYLFQYDVLHHKQDILYNLHDSCWKYLQGQLERILETITRDETHRIKWNQVQYNAFRCHWRLSWDPHTDMEATPLSTYLHVVHVGLKSNYWYNQSIVSTKFNVYTFYVNTRCAERLFINRFGLDPNSSCIFPTGSIELYVSPLSQFNGTARQVSMLHPNSSATRNIDLLY